MGVLTSIRNIWTRLGEEDAKGEETQAKSLSRAIQGEEQGTIEAILVSLEAVRQMEHARETKDARKKVVDQAEVDHQLASNSAKAGKGRKKGMGNNQLTQEEEQR